MSELTYGEMLARNRELGEGLGNTPRYRIAVLSNIVISPLKDILEYKLRLEGIPAEVSIGEYDNIVQDSMRFAGFNAVIIFWEAFNLSDGIAARADAMEQTELQHLVDRVENEARMIFGNLDSVPIVFTNYFSDNLFSQVHTGETALSVLCRRLNSDLIQNKHLNQIFVDTRNTLAVAGFDASIDYRQWYLSRAPYSAAFFKAYAEQLLPAIRAANGRAKKVLVLDCDNTLWGGIIGEDGIHGIKLGNDSREGRIFSDVQWIIRGFARQGVLIALCSKNNPADIDEVLERHPHMVLRAEHIAAKKVGWTDKATMLNEVAKDLNVGIDSLVFVDDSPFELGLVAQDCPSVRCVPVPTQLSNYPKEMQKLGGEFFTLSSTAEDSMRTSMYRAEEARQQTKSSFSTLEQYLASLELRVRFSWGPAVPLERAAQLTQKTNQFNVTTKRYSVSDINKMACSADFDVGSFSVSDKYGDYGITGLVIIEYTKSGTAVIDTFLLSCRVIGRNIELAAFDHIVERLRSKNIMRLNAEYIRTNKNAQVESFFDNLGFNNSSHSPSQSHYYLETGSYRNNNVSYIRVDQNDC